MDEDLALLNQKLEKANQRLEEANDTIVKQEQSEQTYKQKLESVHGDVAAKVDSEHDNVKKMVDMHKTNEELSQQLINKVDQNKLLEKSI